MQRLRNFTSHPQEYKSNILQENTISQVNNHKSEICDEENVQEFSNRYILKSIAYYSHFSLYPNIFAHSNLSHLNINDISKNKEVDLNELAISFYKDRELIIDHFCHINEHVLHISPCFDTMNKIKENSNECGEVIYDHYFDIEDIDLSSS